MAETYTLTEQDYLNCYYDQRSKTKYDDKFEDELDKNIPDFKNIEQDPSFEYWVNATIKYMKYNPAHGDIIDVACMEYRNHGKYQWDATNNKLVNLYTEIDDYGSCNPMFRVGDGPGEFPPGHCHTTKSYITADRKIEYYGEIDHNNFVVLSEKLVSEISTKLVPTKGGYKCQITIAGQLYDVDTVRNNHNSKDVHDCTFQYEHSDRVFIQEF